MAESTALQKYNPQEVNVLMPSTHLQQVSPWHIARVTEVPVSPNPDMGDIYKVGSRPVKDAKGNVIKWNNLYALAKPALMRIAAAAGLVWNFRESGPIGVTSTYACYKAVGALRFPDGSWQPVMATKEIDLEIIEDETYEKELEKADGEIPKARARTREIMLQWRKNKLARAETGAMLRVIRAALGMRSQFTQEELGRPFIVPRIDFAPDYSDPTVRKALLDQGVRSVTELFGAETRALSPSEGIQRAALQAPENDDDAGDQHVIEGEVLHQEDAHEEPQQTRTTTQEPPSQIHQGTTCTDCNREIRSEKVLEISKRVYGAPVCFDCQNKRKAAKEGGTAA